MRKNLVMGLASVGLLATWIFLLTAEILDVLDAKAGEEVVRSDLRTWVTTLLTGLLGSALALLTAAKGDGGGRLGALPTAMGLSGDRLAPAMAFVYALLYVVGIFIGLLVVLTNEQEASSLLLAVSSGGLGTVATGVAAWMGLTFESDSS